MTAAMTESFAELFEQSQAALAKLKPGSIVTGTVVEVRSDVVVINAGLKSEGIVPIDRLGAGVAQVLQFLGADLEALALGFQTLQRGDIEVETTGFAQARGELGGVGTEQGGIEHGTADGERKLNYRVLCDRMPQAGDGCCARIEPPLSWKRDVRLPLA